MTILSVATAPREWLLDFWARPFLEEGQGAPVIGLRLAWLVFHSPQEIGPGWGSGNCAELGMKRHNLRLALPQIHIEAPAQAPPPLYGCESAPGSGNGVYALALGDSLLSRYLTRPTVSGGEDMATLAESIRSLDDLSPSRRMRRIGGLLASRPVLTGRPGPQRLSFAHPLVRRFYSHFGESAADLSRAVRVDFSAVAGADRFVSVGVENQGVYHWAFQDLQADDPLVFGRFEDVDPWLPVHAPLSLALCAFELVEHAMSAPFGGCASSVEPELLHRLLQCDHVDFPLMKWYWPTLGTRLGATGDVAIFACPNGEYPHSFDPSACWSIWVGSGDQRAFDSMASLLSEIKWDASSF